jgi:hypothetical protein
MDLRYYVGIDHMSNYQKVYPSLFEKIFLFYVNENRFRYVGYYGVVRIMNPAFEGYVIFILLLHLPFGGILGYLTIECFGLYACMVGGVTL